MLSYLLKHRRDIPLVVHTDGGKSYGFQSLVIRDLIARVLVIVALNGLMVEQVVNLNNMEIPAIYMNARLLTTDAQLV